MYEYCCLDAIYRKAFQASKYLTVSPQECMHSSVRRQNDNWYGRVGVSGWVRGAECVDLQSLGGKTTVSLVEDVGNLSTSAFSNPR